VAAGISDVPAAVLRSVNPSVLPADSHVLRSGHLLLRCGNGNDGNYRETHLGPVRNDLDFVCCVIRSTQCVEMKIY